MKVFLDANVILDYLTQPFDPATQKGKVTK